jgi:L-alanine-DL-glutamate epimerase-like enolase superfamily enzyme
MPISFGEHTQLIQMQASDSVQRDASCVGGIMPFLQIMLLASFRGLKLAPHFAMEGHCIWLPLIRGTFSLSEQALRWTVDTT